MSSAALLVAIALASGTAIMVSVVTVAAVMSIASIRLRIAPVAASAAVAPGFPFFRKAVQGSVVEVGLVFEPHELGDVLHGRRVQVFACGKESETMLLAVGAEVPLLDLFIGRIGFHTLGQSSRVADALFEAAEVMIGGVKRALGVSLLVIPPLDVTRFLAVQETDDQLVNG